MDPSRPPRHGTTRSERPLGNYRCIASPATNRHGHSKQTPSTGQFASKNAIGHTSKVSQRRTRLPPSTSLKLVCLTEVNFVVTHLGGSPVVNNTQQMKAASRLLFPQLSKSPNQASNAITTFLRAAREPVRQAEWDQASGAARSRAQTRQHPPASTSCVSRRAAAFSPWKYVPPSCSAMPPARLLSSSTKWDASTPDLTPDQADAAAQVRSPHLPIYPNAGISQSTTPLDF